MATQKNNTEDIHDSPKDQEKLKNETATIDLPDVKDIPGQENIQVPRIKEMRDTTASSADEEGDDIFNDDDITDEDSDVSSEEKELLERSAESMASEEDEGVRQAALDDMDDEGELLNETSGLSGEDLDVPGAEDDDEDEEIGEEDEENNNYSIGGENNDN
jgi:hypothetical protein